MPPRRSHKKSRAGCRRCKSRKIKCDEVHPRCGNCTKHGVACDFENPDIADSLLTVETPRGSTIYADTPSAIEPSTPSVMSTPLPLYRRPDPPPLFRNATGNRMMELRLMHHFTTTTFNTLSIHSPKLDNIWKDRVPSLAFGGANFLADALLAVSALHLRTAAPNDQELIRASHAYMASTISEYAASLKEGINESNAEALFLAAALIAFQAAASRMFVRDDSGEIRERQDGYVLPLSWFHAFQGVKAIVASSWHWLRNSGTVVPIIESQPALYLNMTTQDPTFFGDLLDGLEDELAIFENTPAAKVATKQAYHHAIAVLNWAHNQPQKHGAPLVFFATVSRRYVELIEARRPRALAILACYFALLKSLDDIWWLKGVSRREVMGLVSLFNPDDEVWWPRLQWPLRIALYNGNVVPPEIWGNDSGVSESLLSSDPNAGTRFIEHIELLTQFFEAMQSGMEVDFTDISNGVPLQIPRRGPPVSMGIDVSSVSAEMEIPPDFLMPDGFDIPGVD